jgi:hypothetical protein
LKAPSQSINSGGLEGGMDHQSIRLCRYQTLMRQVLKRFAASELKMIARDYAGQVQRAKAEAATAPTPRTPQRKVA